MNQTFFLFDDMHRYLGAVESRDGALLSFELSKEGEVRFGKQFKEWRAQGISVMRESVNVKADDGQTMIGSVVFQIQEEGFIDALRQWFFERGHHVIPMPTEALAFWQKSLLLPLAEDERFSMLSAFCLLPKEGAAGWSSAVEAAITAVKKEQPHT